MRIAQDGATYHEGGNERSRRVWTRPCRPLLAPFELSDSPLNYVNEPFRRITKGMGPRAPARQDFRSQIHRVLSTKCLHALARPEEAALLSAANVYIAATAAVFPRKCKANAPSLGTKKAGSRLVDSPATGDGGCAEGELRAWKRSRFACCARRARRYGCRWAEMGSVSVGVVKSEKKEKHALPCWEWQRTDQACCFRLAILSRPFFPLESLPHPASPRPMQQFTIKSSTH